jgi:ATP-dependent protease ClpP protease subunit
MNKFKYIKDISDKEGVICLYDQIGDSVDASGNYVYGISGSYFASEMQYLAQNCETISVRINSIGGSVLDGYSIVSAILNCPKLVNCYIDGLAASIAGVIAVAATKKVYMMDYGTLMLHNPQGGEDKKVLALIKDTLVTILSNRTNKTPEEIDALMNKETWMSAKEAMDHGMIDEIVSSGKKIKIKKSESLYNMALIYNKALNTQNMTKINALLKISNNADESEQETAIVALQKELTDKNAEIATLSARLKEIEDKQAADELAAKEALKVKATNLANNLEKEGKITKAEVANMIENASKDEAAFEFVSNMASKLGNGKESKKPFDFKNVKPDGTTEDRSTWTFSDWSKKDDKGLLKMKNESPEQFTELYNKEFKK